MNPLSALNLSANPVLGPDLMARVTEKFSPRTLTPSELKILTPPGESPNILNAGTASSSFSNVLGQMVQEVNAKQATAGESVNGLLTGQNVNLH